MKWDDLYFVIFWMSSESRDKSGLVSPEYALHSTLSTSCFILPIKIFTYPLSFARNPFAFNSAIRRRIDNSTKARISV